MTMPEHTITVEAFGAPASPDDLDDLDEILTFVEHREGLMGPVIAANAATRSVSLIATVDTATAEIATAMVRESLGDALVAAGVVQHWRPAEAGEAVIAALPAHH